MVVSERFIPANKAQTSLFEQSAEDQAEAPTLTQLIHYERVVPPKAQQQPVRALLPAHLPREEEIIEPEGLEEGMKKMGEEVTEILEHIPGKLIGESFRRWSKSGEPPLAFPSRKVMQGPAY